MKRNNTQAKLSTQEMQMSSLRSYSKRRVLVDMVEKVKRYARFDSEYLILVVDSAALKVFSSCC